MERTLWVGTTTGAVTPHDTAHVSWTRRRAAHVTARRRKIPENQIFVGGEDEPAYVANFTEALRTNGYLVVRVNAYEAKENRENLLASTDTLDLLGIAKTLLSRRARATGDTATNGPTYHHLREITRCRRSLVRQQTSDANRIHALADQLFPSFLNGSQSALTPFTDASLELMKECNWMAQESRKENE